MTQNYLLKRAKQASRRNAGLFSLLLLLITGISTRVYAQPTASYTIGNGTTTNTSTGLPSPFHDYYEGDRHQFLYLASEMAAAGMAPGLIYAIKWDVTTTNSSNPQGWTMYMGPTTATSLTSTFQATPSILVSGPASSGFYPTTGLNSYSLATPFFWNGTDNILIQTCHGVGSGCRGYTSNASVKYTTLSFNGCTYYQTDCAGSLCAQSTGTATTSRPNVVFSWGSACPASFKSHPQDVQACAATNAVFTAVVDSASVFQWQVNGGAGWVNVINDATYSGVATTSLTVKNAQFSMNNFQYRLVATNPEKSCSVTSNGGKLIMVASSNSTIVIAAEPDTVICKEELVTFHSAYTNGGSSPQYKWLKNGVAIPNETNASLQTKSLSHGDYIQCNFISSGLCVFPSISSGIIFTVTDTIPASVNLTVDYHGGNLYTFTAHPANGGLAPKYYWYLNNKLIPGENGVTYSSEDLHPYDKVTVSMLTSRDCAAPKFSTSRQATTSVASISAAGSSFKLLPNPNKGSFTIQGDNLGNNLALIMISNTIGQVIYKAEVKAEQGVLRHDVNLGNIAPGVYIMHVEANGKQDMTKFTISE